MPIVLQSIQSLLIIMQANGQPIGTGTGFVAQTPSRPVLVTNWHNVSGRNPLTNSIINSNFLVPDEIVIIHNKLNNLGSWVPRTEKLQGPSGNLWVEHPKFGQQADFVALPLTQTNDVHLYPYSLGVGDLPIRCGPADTVSVIGFPFGIQVGGSSAVWATGFIASEPDVDFGNLPVFLIDCRSRPGQSGSAVVSYRSGGMAMMDDGNINHYNTPISRFLGIYSGRINDQSDLGIVWKASAIRELVGSI